MSKKPLKTIVFISLGVFGFLLSGFLLTRTQTPAGATPTENSSPLYRYGQQGNGDNADTRTPDTLTQFRKTEFYRTLIDNNLFRPLGGTPPRPRDPYRLVGTVRPTDANLPKRAILQATAAKKTYTVRIGETLDKDTKVIDIQPKQVTLETAGVQRTLRLNTTPFIIRKEHRNVVSS